MVGDKGKELYEDGVYKMALHTKVGMGEYQILRVPWGWVYTFRPGREFDQDRQPSSVFVPDQRDL